jgi:hypothetical protein
MAVSNWKLQTERMHGNGTMIPAQAGVCPVSGAASVVGAVYINGTVLETTLTLFQATDAPGAPTSLPSVNLQYDTGG